MGALIGMVLAVAGICVMISAAPFVMGAAMAIIPGAFGLYVLKLALNYSLDIGQIVTFTLLITAALFAVLRQGIYWFGNNAYSASDSAIKTVAYTGCAITVLFLVLHFGFHISFPVQFVEWMVNGDNVSRKIK